MKRKLILLTLCMLTVCIALCACANKAISKITLPEDFKYDYALNETPDFSGVQATVTYNDGSTVTVTEADGLTFGTLDTSTPGIKQLTITYEGFSITVGVEVAGGSIDDDDDDGDLVSLTIISSSVKTTILKGEVLDTSGLQVSAVYENATKTLTAADVTITPIDSSVAGEQTLTVSYGGKTAGITITVADVTGIRAAGVPTTVEEGTDLDLTNLKVYAVYSNGAEVLLGSGDYTYVQSDDEVAGEPVKKLVITYGSFEKTVTVSATPPTLESIEITGYQGKVVIGDAYVTDGIVVTAHYSNGTSEQIPVADLQITAPDTATAGEKSLSVTYDGKNATKSVTVLGVTSIAIDKNSVNGGKTKVNLNDTLVTSTIKVIATYSDNSTAIIEGAALSVGSFDTSVPGKRPLTVTYKNVSASIDITVKEIKIMGALLPSSLVQFDANGERFTISDATYMVGDDNPFTFRLALQVLDQNDNLVSFATRYTSTSKVFLVEGGNETQVGTEYVVINETNNTFDFTDAAIGKTFRIETRPLYGVEGIEADCTKSLTVLVVDAYNVTNAKELHLMTNSPESMPAGVSENQVDVAKAFVDLHFGQGYYDTYGGNNLKGFVFHNHIDITTEDLPTSYIVSYTMGGVQKTGFDDHFSLFYRRLNAAVPTFNMYGNYFTIYTSKLPTVCENGSGYNDDDNSSSEIFRFSLDRTLVDTVAELAAFDHTDYKTNIENLAMRDDDPNEDNVDNSARRRLGLIALKVSFQEMTIKNSIIEAYMLSIVPEDDYLTLNLDSVIFNNAWQGHLYVWLCNDLQDSVDSNGTIPDTHQPITINITNSKMTKCGGPVILAQLSSTNSYNAKSAVNVSVDSASEIWSYVTGQEAWFQAHGQAQTAASLLTLDQPLSTTAAGYAAAGAGKNSTILSTQKGTGDTKFVNLPFVAWGGIATYTVDGKMVFNSEDQNVKNFQATPYAQAGAPLFQSSEGGYGTFIGSPENPLPIYSASTFSNLSPEEAAKLFDGDYLGVYIPGFSILLSYYH